MLVIYRPGGAFNLYGCCGPYLVFLLVQFVTCILTIPGRWIPCILTISHNSAIFLCC